MRSALQWLSAHRDDILCLLAAAVLTGLAEALYEEHQIRRSRALLVDAELRQILAEETR